MSELPKPRIAIVEDDAAVRGALGNLLDALGYSVRVYGSAEEFLENEGYESTDCLIADVQMPGMSGLDLLEHLARNGLSTPTILVSAHIQKALQARARMHGAKAYLAKPIREDQLAISLSRALGRSPAL